MPVLYFDDEPFISRSLAENLKLFYNWDITLVSEINDLFQELETKRYSILMLDIMAPVPEMENEFINFTEDEIEDMEGGINTGIILAKKIWEKYGSLPILFLSARQQPEEIKQFQISEKKCDCLRKPDLAKIINEKLNELLNN